MVEREEIYTLISQLRAFPQSQRLYDRIEDIVKEQTLDKKFEYLKEERCSIKYYFDDDLSFYTKRVIDPWQAAMAHEYILSFDDEENISHEFLLLKAKNFFGTSKLIKYQKSTKLFNININKKVMYEELF